MQSPRPRARGAPLTSIYSKGLFGVCQITKISRTALFVRNAFSWVQPGSY